MMFSLVSRKFLAMRNIALYSVGTVFPLIVSAETILFLKLECGKYSFMNLEIVANSNSCRNISIFLPNKLNGN